MVMKWLGDQDGIVLFFKKWKEKIDVNNCFIVKVRRIDG